MISCHAARTSALRLTVCMGHAVMQSLYMNSWKWFGDVILRQHYISLLHYIDIAYTVGSLSSVPCSPFGSPRRMSMAGIGATATTELQEQVNNMKIGWVSLTYHCIFDCFSLCTGLWSSHCAHTYWWINRGRLPLWWTPNPRRWLLRAVGSY